jgi:hypothetical protein
MGKSELSTLQIIIIFIVLGLVVLGLILLNLNDIKYNNICKNLINETNAYHDFIYDYDKFNCCYLADVGNVAIGFSKEIKCKGFYGKIQYYKEGDKTWENSK